MVGVRNIVYPPNQETLPATPMCAQRRIDACGARHATRPPRRVSTRHVLAFGAALLLVTSALVAQLSTSRIDFQFSNPGARSLGMGGAFLALADDATAAYANPAGLVQLTRSEVSIEFRSWDFATPFLAGGRISGTPTGIGIDTIDGPVLGRDESSDSAVSFASFVYPLTDWTFAVHHHQVALLDLSNESLGFFFDSSFFGRFPPIRQQSFLDLTNTGLSAAWQATEKLSLGVSLIATQGRLSSTGELFAVFKAVEDEPDDLSFLYGPIDHDFDPSLIFVRAQNSMDDSGFAFNLGSLWRASEEWTAGLVYRRGARLEGMTVQRDFPTPGCANDPVCSTDPAIEERFASVFNVPTVVAAGIAYQPRPGKLTLALEVDHVGYACLITLDDCEEDDPPPIDFPTTSDATELRFGAEYALLERRPLIAFRAGWWADSRPRDLVPADDEHYTIGLGVAGERVQIDLAVDFAENVDTLSLSAVYRF